MVLSIIVATRGRREELVAMLDSIRGIDFSLIEVIIVDQNVLNFVDDIVLKFKDKFIIKHIRIDSKGVSNARNVGISYAEGKYLSFPDDDCKFYPNTIQLALDKIENYDVVFGKAIDNSGKASVCNFEDGECAINFKNYENRFIEFTMFCKREIIMKYPYDEELGVGTFHGAEEAYDLILRFLKGGVKVFYSSDIEFYHPNKIIDYSSRLELKRVFTYRCGYAKLCVKHKFYMKYIKRLFLVFCSLPLFLVINRKKARYYLAEFLGLLSGLVIR